MFKNIVSLVSCMVQNGTMLSYSACRLRFGVLKHDCQLLTKYTNTKTRTLKISIINVQH
jgi:hypothetical protein